MLKFEVEDDWGLHGYELGEERRFVTLGICAISGLSDFGVVVKCNEKEGEKNLVEYNVMRVPSFSHAVRYYINTKIQKESLASIQLELSNNFPSKIKQIEKICDDFASELYKFGIEP